MARTFAVRVNKMVAIRLLGAAMRKKIEQHNEDKEAHKKALADLEAADARALDLYKQQVARAKCFEQLPSSRPYSMTRPSPPKCSLCDENQLLTMLRADTREEIPVPEGSLLWTLIQGRCTPLK